MRKFYGNWNDHNDMWKDFGVGLSLHDMIPNAIYVDPVKYPTSDEILFASYEHESYDGYAFVVYEKEGKLYEVNGSHCSCYGLEDQWDPEETSWKALKMRNFYGLHEGEEVLQTLINAHE